MATTSAPSEELHGEPEGLVSGVAETGTHAEEATHAEEEHHEEGGHGGLHVTLAADPIFHIGGFTVTNALLVTWIASAILLVTALRFSRNIRTVPGRFQALLEIVFDGLLTFMDAVTGSRAKTQRFGPITLTIFFLVLVANWLELFPGFESIFIHGVPLLRAPSSDFNLTLSIAVIAVVSTHVLGVRTLGALKHIKKYFSANPINTFIGIIEIVGDFAKILSFSLRLFGNIFAGSILLLVIGFLVPWGAPLPFMGLELIVGLIQALVFSVLTLVFMTMATEEHH
jgi:F-type H+-transporting ATPase subunit a